jgi:uncharacterized protein YbaP (TraB family)
MKQVILFVCSTLFILSSEAQLRTKEKKYQSLLWEITGPGLKKSSWLIGTMHVSNKLAFHLPDSFYYGIRQSEVVALETNPETWQEDMNRYDMTGGYGGSVNNYESPPEDYLSQTTLKFYKYHGKIERSLYSNPSTINNLLYRTYGNETADFEEDTYLDMYIFQVGKKWGKKVAGVEDYGESMKLMEEAYRDAAKDKSRKVRSYGDMDEDYSIEKLQEAYRKGDLDLLDSINRYNSFSLAFDEKFLFRRNEIQADNIDSIIRTGASLFVGVGAAHLPGDRGVIELLREKGYKLRPVKMGERAGRDKDLVDKIRVPVQFKTHQAADGLFRVDIPGRFYKFGDDGALDQHQYADMANGSYYMVTRIMTNAWMWAHTEADVYRAVDSLLYENVPGKIQSRSSITRNGYKGFDITNRTRRGDLQRYQIFITPFEVIFFKISGNGDYVKNGPEADRFFNSIQLKEFSGPTVSWKKFSPTYGGFSINLPHEPYLGNDGSWIWDAADAGTGTYYRIIRTDVHNYNFLEEDSFDLGLMDESFLASGFIRSQENRRHTTFKGYPALDTRYLDKYGNTYLVRFIIQGPHYYTLAARGKTVTPQMQSFLESFAFEPLQYPKPRRDADTSLYYSVQLRLPEPEAKIKLDIPEYSYYDNEDDEEEDDPEDGMFRTRIIRHDSTGERLYVGFFKAGRYAYLKDSSLMDEDRLPGYNADSTVVVRSRKKTLQPDGTQIWDYVLADTGSSRVFHGRTIYREGIGYRILTQGDTLSRQSDFVRTFFETFEPADTLKGNNIFTPKIDIFVEDFLRTDSIRHKRALKNIHFLEVGDKDLPNIKKLIDHLNGSEKDYVEIKTALIGRLGQIKTPGSDTYLKELYYAAGDTVKIQYAALENLLQHETQNAYNVFRDIINQEPPVLDLQSSPTAHPDYTRYYGNFDNGNFLDELSDSLELTKTILPALLPLLDLDDYENTIRDLLREMVDSNLVKPSDYEAYFSQFLIQAKQELRKQLIAEKNKAIEKAEEAKEEEKPTPYSYYETSRDDGNEDLSLYATLLLPWRKSNPQVQHLFNEMLSSNDKELKYYTMMLLIRNQEAFPDTLPGFFAADDDYRYAFYSDLKELKQSKHFPAKYNNHLDLGRSQLLGYKTYGKPDSIIYLERLLVDYKGRNGYVYFYKVKEKKDDFTWKIAMVGITPTDPKQFEFTNVKPGATTVVYTGSYQEPDEFGFTQFTDTRYRPENPLQPQMERQWKRSAYTRRKSAKQFYPADGDASEEGSDD